MTEKDLPEQAQHPEKDPEDWTTGGEPMTGPQASYLTTLLRRQDDRNRISIPSSPRPRLRSSLTNFRRRPGGELRPPGNAAPGLWTGTQRSQFQRVSVCRERPPGYSSTTKRASEHEQRRSTSTEVLRRCCGMRAMGMVGGTQDASLPKRCSPMFRSEVLAKMDEMTMPSSYRT